MAIPGWDVPYDYYDDPPDDECAHEDYEVDILTGEATCDICGHRWYQTAEQIAAQARAARAYDEWLREQESPWGRFKDWCRRRWPNGLRYQTAVPDDDVPF